MYIDGLGIDEHMGKIDSSNVLTFTRDHLGTVVNDEAVSEKSVTGSFGEQLGADLISTQSSAPVRYGYTGREYDAESDTYFYKARSYDQNLGRFLTEDPIGIYGGDPNLFRYVRNNSIDFVDGLGLAQEQASDGARFSVEFDNSLDRDDPSRTAAIRNARQLEQEIFSMSTRAEEIEKQLNKEIAVGFIYSFYKMAEFVIIAETAGILGIAAELAKEGLEQSPMADNSKIPYDDGFRFFKVEPCP